MEAALVNFMGIERGGLVTRGRSLLRAHNVRVVMSMPIHGISTTIAVPLRMTEGSKSGLLLLDEHMRPSAREGFRDDGHGHLRSQAQVYMDVWPEGPKQSGKYVNQVEQFARSDWPQLLQKKGPRRMMAFELRSEKAVADEFMMRVLAAEDEVEHPEPENLLLWAHDELTRGKLDVLPPVVYADGEQVQLKALAECTITNIDKDTLSLQEGKNVKTIPIPAGLSLHERVRPGRTIRRGQALFCFPDTDLKHMPMVHIFLKAIEDKMFLDLHGTRLVRLKYATKVAHYCLKCQHKNGVFQLARLVCPECHRELSEPKTPDGNSIRVSAIKPDTLLCCSGCHNTDRSERFRQHTVCTECGAAAVPAIRKAYVSCNSRHYSVSTRGLGKYLPDPREISGVKSFFRRLRQQGQTPEELVAEAEAAGRRAKAPQVYRVA